MGEVNTYQVSLPQIIRFGAGTLNTLKLEISRLGAKKALIVTDPGVFQTGLTEPVKEQILKANTAVEIYANAEPEPTLPILNEAAAKLRKEHYDLLLAVGGGSSIDTAKGLSILLAHGGTGQDYVGVDQVPGPGVPVIAIPTTAGTGSEVTNIAIFTDPEKEVKLGIVSPYLLARMALVDPFFTYNCPRGITAASGIDALVHAIESFTSKDANDFSDAFALKAMRLIASSLKQAVFNGSDKNARDAMMEGALFGGISFGNAGVAAVHALAYQLGGQFHVSHGVANGILLPYVMECNLPVDYCKFAIVAQSIGVKTDGLSDKEAAEQGVAAVKQLVKDIGIPEHLRDLKVPQEALEGMAAGTMTVTRLLAHNPKALTLEDVRGIWQNAW
jgi:alcohol dehydrogenase class IV